MTEKFGSLLPIFIGFAVLVFLAFLLYKLLTELLRLSREREEPSFESNWGGLGRGLGGWSVNRMMLITLLTLLVFALFFAVTILLLSEKPAPPKVSGASVDHPASPATSGSSQLGETPSDTSSWNVEIVNCQPPGAGSKSPGKSTRHSDSSCPATLPLVPSLSSSPVGKN